MGIGVRIAAPHVFSSPPGLRRHDGCPLSPGTEMIELPRGPRTLLPRILRPSSIALCAIVAVLLLSPPGNIAPPPGSTSVNSPEFTFYSSPPVSTFASTKLTPVSMESPVAQQQPPAVDDGQQDPPEVTDPALLAILESNPDTPVRRLRAVLTLMDMGRPELGAQFLEDLTNAQLDDATLFELHKSFGSAAVLRLRLTDQLQPQAGEFAELLATTAERVAHDPARLATVAGDLASGNAETRYRAMAELRHGESAAAAVLINILADENRAAASGTAGDDVIDNEVLQEALVALKSDAVAPLCGAMDCPKPHVQVAAASVLNTLRSRDAVKFLLPGVSSDDASVSKAVTQTLQSITSRNLTAQEAAQYLYAEANALYLGEPVWRNRTGEQTRLWTWSAEEQTVTPKSYTQLHASYAAAALLAKKLHEIAPNSAAATNLYANAALQSAAAEQGTVNPLQPDSLQDVQSLGPVALNAALAEALADNRHLSAWGALNLLGDSSDPRLLHMSGREVAPIAAACSSPDPRVQFAAANAILKLNPTISFPGSSFVTRTLGHFAATSGRPRLVIADTRTVDAQQLAGLARLLGYHAETANVSRALIEQAYSSPDYQAILLDITLPNADIDLVVQQLRKDPRTAGLPIGFIAPTDRQRLAENYARRYGSAAAVIRPHSEEVFVQQLSNVLESAEIAPLSDAERVAYANASIRWLAALANANHPLFNPLPEAATAQNAMYSPELAMSAIEFQAACGLPECQTALVDFASTGSLPVETRRAAAAGFAQSLDRYGILLTSSQIARQYDRYNASSTADEETIAILGSLLDAIEAVAARND